MVFDVAKPVSKALIDRKFRVEGLIGSGGMGRVYKATQLDIGRKVAVKKLHAKYIDDSIMVERFLAEARAAGSIGHHNICEVTHLGRDNDGVPYLVMPLLDGDPLSTAIHCQGLSIARSIDITCQILAGLGAAHAKNIIHRDLKPANIFITQIGDRHDFVKVLDFGISKILDGSSAVDLTHSGNALGTSYYMAPEQAQGLKLIDHRVDIYAVGVILYEALTRKRPFEGSSYNNIIFKIITQPFELPRAVNADIPAELEEIVLRAMKKDATERFESAESMLQALSDVNLNQTGDPRDSSTSVVPVASPLGRSLESRDDDINPQTPDGFSQTDSTDRFKDQKDRTRSAADHTLGILVLIIAVLLAIIGLFWSGQISDSDSTSQPLVAPKNNESVPQPTQPVTEQSNPPSPTPSIPEDAADRLLAPAAASEIPAKHPDDHQGLTRLKPAAQQSLAETSAAKSKKAKKAGKKKMRTKKNPSTHPDKESPPPMIYLNYDDEE